MAGIHHRQYFLRDIEQSRSCGICRRAKTKAFETAPESPTACVDRLIWEDRKFDRPSWAGALTLLYRYFPGVVYGWVCREDRSVLARNLHDAEAITVGIFQHDEVFVRTVSARIPGRPDLDQPLHFALLVVCVEVQVHSFLGSPGRPWTDLYIAP